MNNKLIKYRAIIDSGIKLAYEVANKARRKGFDPEEEVEIPLAKNMAERVEGLLSVVAPQVKGTRIVTRINELEREFGGQDWRVAFTLALEVAKEKFCKFKDKKEAIEIGMRAGLAYITNGVVASPLEGFTRLGIKKRRDGREYFALYFAGPIRSAGTTAICVFVALADYLRKEFGYGEYDPDEIEIKRIVTELYDFHERVTNLQYLPSEEELEFMVKNLPLQIDGEATEKYEVSNYKDLDRMETNVLRNGVALVFGEGLTQKSKKFWGKFSKWCDDFDMGYWKFLDGFVKLQEKIRSKQKEKTVETKEKIKPDYGYIKDLVAGRPVLTHPLASGGLRLRYGRCRNSGFSSQAIHPATMVIVNRFIAIGTQLKVERPGKATTLASCDTIEGPIVKLNNGDVLLLETVEEAERVSKDVDEILYLGDVLINYGDFLNRAHVLVPPGYCEEWWMLESGSEKYDINIEEAIEFCKKGKPLHPRYCFHWKEIDKEKFDLLVGWLKKASVNEDKIILPYEYDVEKELKKKDPKRALELLGVPHLFKKEHVVIEYPWCKALMFSLGNNLNNIKMDKEDVLEIVNELSKTVIRDKSGTTIGARMGRPEKAKMRKLTGSPQVLFPVGKEGGRMRCFQSALEKGRITADFPLFYCYKCNKETIFSVCHLCGNKPGRKYYSKTLGLIDNLGLDKTAVCYKNRSIDINEYFDSALKILKTRNYPELIKGVRGTSNKEHVVEHLVKGILRAMHGLYVNKDGTVRYDMTETAITHFKPKEIGTSIEKLKEIGYGKDIHGNDLVNDNQILEIQIQDVILPSCDETPDEKAEDVLFNVATFVDELLVKLYNEEKFYNLKNKKDLVGHLVVGMSPHTSAGVVGRIIGFSNTQGFYCHPYFHSLMRRDCLGYDSYVSVKRDDKWQIKKIGEFVEELNPTDKVDFFGTLKKDLSNISAWSNPGEKTVKEATKHMPTDLIRVYLEDGRQIELTKNHKVYVKGKKEKMAYQLTNRDKVMVSYRKDISERDIKEIFLPEIFKYRKDVMIRNIRDFLMKFQKLSKHDNFCYRDSFPITFVRDILTKNNLTLNDLPSCAKISIKRDNLSLPIRINLSEKLLEVLGLYLAEGYARKNDSKKGFYHVSISMTNEKIKKLVKDIFFTYFGLEPSEDHADHLTYSSRLLYELFIDYLGFGIGAKGKRIPSLFLDLKKEKIAAFLRGYYEGDGSVSKTVIRVSCDTVSEGLKHDLSFVLSRFNIFTKFYEYEKEPGPKVREFYIRKNRKIPKFKITKLIIPSNFVREFEKIGFISDEKKAILDGICKRKPYGMKIDYDSNYVYPRVKKIEEIKRAESYCLNVPSEHNFFANDLLVHNCDGDEACVILLMDALLNFSRKYIPGHRGAKQDEPLVLSSYLIPSEVDDMVFDMDIVDKYPLEFYLGAMEYKYPWDIKIKTVKSVLGTDNETNGFKFTHDTSDINLGVVCSSYKSIPTMLDKVEGQMRVAEKIRAVDENDVARLVIERHFIRDIKGNLRKFGMQQFRCVDCNEKYRRPPLSGQCKCGGRLIFTISEGSIVKYLEPSLFLAERYNLPNYLKQTLELTKQRIESVFGKDKEKQEGLIKWFGKK
ncbi:MAG: DNA polymerase II large subunit [Nanoarchaeota archaeon]